MIVTPSTYEAYRLVHDGALALARAEQQGIRVDLEYCKKQREELTEKIKLQLKALQKTRLWAAWAKVYGSKANVDSNQQLSYILYEELGLTPPKMSSSGKQGATDEEALSRLKLSGLDCVLAIRKLRKLRDTYLDAFVREASDDGYIHPFFNLHTVKTFRSSSDQPNFQNIPARDKESMRICRQALYPRPGHQLLEVDFSGIEVAVAACYHKDPTMLKYLSDSKSDLHGDMARQIFLLDSLDRHKYQEHRDLRYAAKNGFVFPQFYGDYYANNAANICGIVHLPSRGRWKRDQGMMLPPEQIHLGEHFIRKGIRSYQDFEEHLQKIQEDFWGRKFRKYQQWKDRWVHEYNRKGFFQTLTGFTCSGVMTRNEVINYPVQGSAFHCLLWSFIEIDKIARQEGWDTRLVGQVHDCVVLDVHPDELEHVAYTVGQVTRRRLPEAWSWIIVPLGVEAELCGVDESWAEKKSFVLPEEVN